MKIVLNETELKKLQELKLKGEINYTVTSTSTDSVLTWQDGPVVTAMRLGTVLLLDEIDQARTSIMCLNTIAQGKPYYIKKTNELVVPKKGFNLIGTANSKGDGSAMDKFAGTQNMNEAFLDRFYFNVEQQYPNKDVEVSILNTHSSDYEFVNTLVKIAGQLREGYKKGDVDFRLTTRRLVHIITNYNILGNKMQAIRYAIARFEPDEQDIILELYSSLTKPKTTPKRSNQKLKYENIGILDDQNGIVSKNPSIPTTDPYMVAPPKPRMHPGINSHLPDTSNKNTINSDILLDELSKYIKTYNHAY